MPLVIIQRRFLTWWVTLWLAGLAGLPLSAKPRVPSLLSDGLVLQENEPNRVWGTASPGEAVGITFRRQTLSTTADSAGRWQVFVQPEPAGGPDELIIRGEDALVIHDVLVGEIWVASGQSNMRWMVEQSSGAEKEIPQANFPAIRFFQVTPGAADEPQEDVAGSWRAVSPATVGKLSGIGYYFARSIHQKMNVPVGVIQATYGATPAQAWTSRQTLEKDPLLEVYLQRWKQVLAEYPAAKKRYELQLTNWEEAVESARSRGTVPPKKPLPIDGPGGPRSPSGLFNAMIAPLTPFTIRGVIWYQGEDNTKQEDAYAYRRLFPAMILDWRRHWGQGPFPFLFAQLSIDANTNAFPELRESQLATLQVQNTAMVVTLDVGEPFGSHPTDKKSVGERFALAARSLAYGEKLEYSGPLYRRATIEGHCLRLWFDHCAGGLRSRDGGPLKEFEIAGPSHEYVPAEARIDGRTLLLSNGEVPAPVAARYAWVNDARPANLVSAEGLPASAFRTDEEKTLERFCVPVPTGKPAQTMWPTQALFAAPAIYPAEDPGLKSDAEIRPLFYDGPPFHGKPTRVFAWLGVPANHQAKVPGIVLVHGGGGTAFRYWVKLWVDRGYAAIAMDTSGQVPDPLSPVQNARKGHAFSGPEMGGTFDHVDDPPTEQWVYHAVAAIVRAHSLLRSLPDVDPERTGLTGISWGGMFVEIAAGVDPRFKFVAPVYGCGFLGENSFFLEANMQRMGREPAVKWLTLWDPSQYIGYAKMPMLFCDGTNDKHFRPDSWQKTYRTAQGPRTLSMKLRMPHGHPPAGDPREITIFADSILRGGEPLPKLLGQGRDRDSVWATYSATVRIEKAELLYTRDRGDWRERHWETAAADLDPNGKKVTARLPQGTTVYFLNLTDSRGCIVSTEHEETR
jgi:sialate O-acetylesterase